MPKPKYGWQHQKARRQWATLLPLPCTVCHQTVLPGSDWHLDHTDDGLAYLGAAHAHCNTSKGARKLNRMQAGKPAIVRRLEL